MTVEVAALLAESLSLVVTLVGEGSRRRNGKASLETLQSLTSLDLTETGDLLSDVQLAHAMRGAMNSSLAAEVLADRQMRRLTSELLLAAMADGRRDELQKIELLLKGRTQSILDGRVAPDDSSYFGTQVSQLLAEKCRSIIAAAMKGAPGPAIGIQQMSSLKRMTSILDNVSKQLDAAMRSLEPDKSKDRLKFIAEYRELAAEVHGLIRPPDFDTNQHIPIEHLYVAPGLSPAGSSEDDVRLSLEAFERAIDRTVVLGDPGGGKSTLANYLTTGWARSTGSALPFHVTLRDFAQESGLLSVIQFIEKELPGKYQISPPPGLVEDLLLDGHVTVIFDGLDELVDTTKRRAVTSAVELFGHRFPLVRILVTSRRVGYEQAQLDPAIYDAFHIDRFADQQVAEYVRKWFSSQQTYDSAISDRLADDFMSQSEVVGDLRSNPLMLSLMCIIFRGDSYIPRNRPAIYEKCANLLFEKWDGHRQIEVPLQARDHVDAAMKHVAYLYLENGAGDSGMARGDLIREMTNYLHPRAMETREAAERAAIEFIDYCAGRAWVFSDAGTTAAGEPLFTFTHRTFMEYFAAVHLIRITDTPELLAKELLPRIAREEWNVVAQLAVQQADKSSDTGTQRVLLAMTRDRRKRSTLNRSRVLNFVANCLTFAVVSPASVREISLACVNFVLDPESADLLLFHQRLTPWVTLADTLAEEHLQVALDAQRDRLLEVLNSPTGERYVSAVFLAELGLVRRFNGRIWRRGLRHTLWGDMFTDLVSENLDLLTPVIKIAPALWGSLLLGEAVSPEHAVEQMKVAGMSFGEIYFGEGGSPDFETGGQSIALSFLRSISDRREPVDPRDESIVLTVAKLAMADFWAGAQPPIAPHAGDAYWSYAYPSLAALNGSDVPEVVRDLLMVSTLGASEIALIAAGTGHTSRTISIKNQESLQEGASGGLRYLGLSEKMLDFGEKWLRSEVSVFAKPFV